MERGPLRDLGPNDILTARATGVTSVDLEPVVGDTTKVSRKNIADRMPESQATCYTSRPEGLFTGHAGIKPREMQRLVRVDVPDPGDETLIHKDRLERTRVISDHLDERCAVQSGGSWKEVWSIDRLGTNLIHHLLGDQLEPTELSGIMVPEDPIVIESEPEPDVSSSGCPLSLDVIERPGLILEIPKP